MTQTRFPHHFRVLAFVFCFVISGFGFGNHVVRAQISAGEHGVCGASIVERGVAASPDLIAGIEELTEQLSSVYGESVEKTLQLFQDDSDWIVVTRTSYLGDAHVFRDVKGGYVLSDETEIPLGDWRPAVLTVEVTRDGFAMACHFADVGSAGDKVLFAPHSMGLFFDDEKRTYLADFEVNGMYVAIDLDGNLIGSGVSDYFVDSHGDPSPIMTRSECASRSAMGGAGPRFAACFTQGEMRQEGQTCCGDLARECRQHSDFGTLFAIRDNIRDCYDGCSRLFSEAQIQIQSP